MLSTSQKIRIARGLSAAVLSIRNLRGLTSEVIVTRRGVTWSLNLKEGIDLAIYLLGGFELRTLRRYAHLIKEGDIVLDIGANVGAHTLPLAQLVGPSGRVFSFEPTTYAYAKQKRNIELNPRLASRICAYQMMLMATDSDPLPESVYSSWPLEAADDLHAEHHGRLKDTRGAINGTLDSFIRSAGIKKIDFIKLDVDGNENDVLAGAKNVITESKPKIMIELAPYVYSEHPHKFDELLEVLWRNSYQISNIATGSLLPQDPVEIRRSIPDASGLNVLAEFRYVSRK